MEKKIAIVGFGNQARAWAENLKESGWDVTILLRTGSKTRTDVETRGLKCSDLPGALADFAQVALLLPDDAMTQFCKTHQDHFRTGQALIFAHGFSVHYQTAAWPTNCDLILVAPKGIGTAVRKEFVEGRGVPAVLAVENDVSGHAWQIAEDVAEGIGSNRVGTYRATFREEVLADLFSEQALLCGGLPALLTETFNLLIRNGIHPKVAYLECVHELAFIANLVAERGISAMLRLASPTAQFGGIRGGNKLLTDELRKNLEQLFSEIENGEFVRHLQNESKAGFPTITQSLQDLGESTIEKVGSHVREALQKGHT